MLAFDSAKKCVFRLSCMWATRTMEWISLSQVFIFPAIKSHNQDSNPWNILLKSVSKLFCKWYIYKYKYIYIYSYTYT